MMHVLLIAYLVSCWVWPFVFVFCLVQAIRGPQTGDISRISRNAAII